MIKTKLLRRILPIAIGVLSITTLATSAILKHRHNTSTQLTNDDQLEIELVTLTPAGFEPAEITRPKGSFVLFVEDRSGRENSSLGLQRANGERIRTVSLQRRKSKWNDIIDLTPGTYVLQDVNNSAVRCQITILP